MKRRLAIVAAATVLAACTATYVGTTAQRVGVSLRSRVRAVALALCPVPTGCFAYPPACEISSCFCPKVCGRVVFPIWSRGSTAACRCTET